MVLKKQDRHVCGVCGEPRSKFILNNKAVCLRCDELLFDLEIECDEETRSKSEGTSKELQRPRPSVTLVKKG